MAMKPVFSVLDWGIGGAGLLAALRARRPDIAVRYRSDSGAPPWGTLPTATLARRLTQLLWEEHAAGATGALLACNAASTVLPHLAPKALPPLPHGLHGVITPGVAAVRARGWRHVGIVGGARTIRSGAWARPLRAAGVLVTQRVAQPLSARIERGDLHSPATFALVARLCAPLTRCEAVILGCTHYPAARAAFEAALPGVALFDPAPATLDQLLRAVPAADVDPAPAPLTAWTSGSPDATRDAAKRVFHIDLGPVGQLAPPHLG